MRISIGGLLLLGVTAGAGLSAGAQAAGVAGADGKPAAGLGDGGGNVVQDNAGVEHNDAAGVTLTLMPSNFNLNRSISFDDSGEPRHRQNQLSVNFRCFYESQATPLSYRDLEITSVITSAGEELEIDPEQQRRQAQNIRPDRQRNGKPYFDLYLNLPAPTRTAQAIRELRGQLTIELSRGPERVLRLAPVSDYIGKRFRVTDMDDSPMSIQKIAAQNNQPAMIEWTHARSIEPLVQEIKFYRRNGVEFEPNQRGGRSDNTTRSQRFQIDAPDDAVMVVRLFRQTREVVVPFTVRDLPLPAAEPAGPRFDLAIATEAIGAAGAKIELPDKPAEVLQPGENDLPIIILD